MADAESLKRTILDLVDEYHDLQFTKAQFVPGQTPVPVSGRVFDSDELVELVDAALEFWLTAGRYTERFETALARRLEVGHAVLCNSGSSANLLAISALTSESLGEARLHPGDEVITVAAGFPTTVNPIVQNRLTPVFVDVDPVTFNLDATELEEAIGPRTRAVALAHTLGNPFAAETIIGIAKRSGLWLVEDACDALGGVVDGKPVGSLGDLATLSFYPAHQITMGEGGCVLTSSAKLRKIVTSFRDWGRDCWCPTGADNTCRNRFGWQLGDLPAGYDHKYVYSHIGYNLKATDLQAAVGVAQLAKLDAFVALRRRNWRLLKDGLGDLQEYFQLPVESPGTEPSWFGFLLVVRDEAPFERSELLRFLDARRIGTRLLFGGDLRRQPAYKEVPHRAVGPLPVTELVMRGAFWLGVYPGLSEEMLGYVVDTLHEFVAERG